MKRLDRWEFRDKSNSKRKRNKREHTFDGAVFVAMLCGDFFKAEIQYYNYDGVMLGTFPEDVDEYFGSGEVEEVKNELEKLVKQDEKENKEISRQ